MREGGATPPPEAAPTEALPAGAPPATSRTSQLADRFERALSLSRLVVVVPVIVLLLTWRICLSLKEIESLDQDRERAEDEARDAEERDAALASPP